MKRLHLSQTHKLLGGVLGGLGEYTNIDPVAVRLIFIVLLVATGLFPGVILYLLAWVLIPQGTALAPSKPVDTEPVAPAAEAAQATEPETPSAATSHESQAADADDSLSV